MGAFSNLIGSFSPTPETRLPPEEKPAAPRGEPALEPVSPINLRDPLVTLAKSGAFATPTKLWLSTIIGDTSDITENNFSEDEVSRLRTLVGNHLNEIKRRTGSLPGGSSGQRDPFRAEMSKRFDYESYFLDLTEEDVVDGRPPEDIANLQQSLGRFSLRRDKDGNVIIRDWYDFHYPGQPVENLDIGRRLGQAIAPGGSGRVIRINLGPASQFGEMGQSIPLESEDPFPAAEEFTPSESPIDAILGSFLSGLQQ